MTTLEIFRLIATEFSTISDTDVNKWIELTEPLISESRFGNTYKQALAYLTAHKMKMAGLGDTSVGKIDDMMRVSSYSEGSVSISYSTGGSGGANIADEEYRLTAYGRQYLTIRCSKIIPIISAGEAH